MDQILWHRPSISRSNHVELVSVVQVADATGFVASLRDWRARRGPAYRKLTDAIREAIAAGTFPVGSTIPPERKLAETLGVSRTTVVGAYEALREEGWLESVQGSGTRVTRAGAPPAPPPPGDASHRRNTAFRGLIDSSGSAISFLGLHLPAISPHFEEAMAEAARDARSLLRHHGYTGLGLISLREAIALHLSRAGLPTRSAEVLVTHGAQQAIGLSATLLLRRGDAVVLEDPTYLGAIDLFGAAGARLIPVPVGRGGIALDRLSEAMARERPRVLYLMPNYQNPVGAVLPVEARREIAALAEKHDTAIIEDGTLEELDFGTPPPPPIGAFARGARVITVGSLSKVIWGGLRIGWLRAPEPLLASFAHLKVMSDLGNSPISQSVAARLMRRLPEIRARRRDELAERFETLAAELSARLPEWAWDPPLGGMSIWVRLPRGNAEEFAPIAQRHGVAILPGSLFSPSNGFSEYVRLPFCLEPREIRDGVRRLARAWKAYVPARAREGSPTRPLNVVV